MANGRKPLIIDCDPGHDDVIAILLALGNPEVDLRAITVTAGNNTLENTLRNTLRVLTHIGVTDIPVAAGASTFLFQPHRVATAVHGETGLDGPALPEPSFREVDLTAVELMAKIIRESDEPVVICPMGPMPNVAAFVLAHPELLPKVELISFMGGAAFGGNATATAEFNIWQDPEAAEIVLRSGVPLAMLGLDVTFKAMILPEEKEKLRAMGNKAGVLAAELLDFFEAFHRSRGRVGAPQHDACAVAYAIDPTLFTFKKLNVTMDLDGEYTRGCTTTDFYNVTQKPPNCNVCFEVDRERFVKLIFDAVSALN